MGLTVALGLHNSPYRTYNAALKFLCTGSSPDVQNNILFTGRYYDTESQTYYYRARNYHPYLGRFLQRDPLGESVSLNLYAYVFDNPINSVDPTGMMSGKLAEWYAPRLLGADMGWSLQQKMAYRRSNYFGETDATFQNYEDRQVGEDEQAWYENQMAEWDAKAARVAASRKKRDADEGKVDCGVVVKGAGSAEGVERLAANVGLQLYIDDSGHLQVKDPPMGPTKQQQIVLEAILSPNTITLDFQQGGSSGIWYAASDSHGTHTFDMDDLAALDDSRNHSSFTAGNVVLHELAEGYAEVNPTLIKRDYKNQSAHDWANQFAPGLSTPDAYYTGTGTFADKQGATHVNYLAGVAKQMIQDGTCSNYLTTYFRYYPPRPIPSQSGKWYLTGPIYGVVGPK